MDLKSGKLLWPDLSRAPRDTLPLNRDLDCEVLIIGSGVSGAICATLLAKAGVKVAMVDRRAIVSGSTPASTAMLMYEIDQPLVKLAEDVGLTNARRAYARCYRAMDEFSDLVGQLDDQSDLIHRQCVYLAGGESDVDLLSSEVEARAAIGIDATFLTREQIQQTYRIDRPCAIQSEKSMEIDPYRLTLSLLREAQRHGTAIYPKTEVELQCVASGHVFFQTPDGHNIRAKHAVFASGYETPEMLDGDYAKLRSTYAIATNRLSDDQFWKDRPLIWEHQTPYCYARSTTDNRIVFGGEDEDICDPQLRDAVLELKSKVLLERLRTLMPWVDAKVEYAWAGTFAETKDGLPLIGGVKHLPNCHFALGYGGNGITFSLIAGQIIRDRILGKHDPDEDVFSFDRLKSKDQPKPESLVVT